MQRDILYNYEGPHPSSLLSRNLGHGMELQKFALSFHPLTKCNGIIIDFNMGSIIHPGAPAAEPLLSRQLNQITSSVASAV